MTHRRVDAKAGVIGPVCSGYALAWSSARQFAAIHIAARLIVSAVVVPLSGLVLAAAMATSEQSAVTDQDIALFLATPAGFGCALAIFGLFVAAAVFDLAMMTVVLRRPEHATFRAAIDAWPLVFRHLPALFGFGVLVLLRILAIAAPFVIVAGGIAMLAIAKHDINYYLTHRPPEFLAAAGLISLVLMAMAALLIWKASGWVLAMHLLLTGRATPRRVFAESARLLQGQRPLVVKRLLVWLAIRVVLGAVAAAAAGFAIGGILAGSDADLRWTAAMTIAILLLWVLAGALVNAVSNGALAALLDALYQGVSGDEPRQDAAVAPGPGGTYRTALVATVLVLGAASTGGGLLFTGDLLEQVRSERIVEIIAHRGASGSRPENTMAAVRKALEDRADWVEIDVQETADGEVIVAHDSDFMKLGGIDLKVWDATMADVARIDIGSWFDPSFSGQRTPTLRDVLTTAKGAGKVLIELKYYGHDVRLEQRVAEIVEETGMESQIAVMSLKISGIRKMQDLRPDWTTGILAATAIGDLSGLKADFLAVNTGQVSVRMIRRAHAKGRKVYVWTVDDPLTMSRMISMGIDGLITNEPALAREVMARRNGLSTAERLLLWLVDRFRLGSFDPVADGSDA